MFVYFIAFVVLRSSPAFSGFTEYAPSSSNPTGNEQIDHAHFLTNDISHLCLNERFSDIVLTVDNEKLPAHRFVLASRSDYFRGMLNGYHKEAREMEVPIMEASATSFKALLKYIYSGRMDLSVFEGNTVLELLILSNKFCFSNLQIALYTYLKSNISIHNVCSLLAVACLFQLKDLEVESLKFIDIHALDVLQSEDSSSLSPEAFQLILNRDTAYANDLDLFRAACHWIKKNQDKLGANAKTKILSAVRYQHMIGEELAEVRQSELVCWDKNILDVIKFKTNELNYRGNLEPNVNFAKANPYGISEIENTTMLMLDRPSNINYIEMKLCDVISRIYSYYVEVSMDRHVWVRVVDYSNYDCRSIQRLWIKRRLVRYIRLVCTNNISNKTFVFFKVMYNTDEMHLVEIKNGLVVPKHNVASLKMDATVIDGNLDLFSQYNVLLNGDFKTYGKDYGFADHIIGSGSIEVQLSQPYVLGSMRILILDCDKRSYGYTIDVSVNYVDWERIIDKSNESCRSWQLLKFEDRPIVYIRIKGIHTSKKKHNVCFKCVHLEAPAQVSLDSEVAPKQQRLLSRLFSLK